MSEPEPQEKPKKAKVKRPPKFHRDIADHIAASGGKLKADDKSPFCLKCGLNVCGSRKPYLEFHGSTDPLITVIFDAVGRKEDAADEIACAGSQNNLLLQRMERFSKELGFDMSRVRVISTTRCANFEPQKINYATKGNWCRVFTVEDLRKHPPRLVMPVGTTALGLLSHKSNAQDWAGRLLNWRGYPDDWLTDARYADSGHPSMPLPTEADRRPMLPVLVPRLVFMTQNPVEIRRWEKTIKLGMQLALDGVKPQSYDRPWFRLLRTADEVAAALKAIPDGAICSYDLETTGLLPFGPRAAIVFVMFRYDLPDGTKVAFGFPWQYPESPLVNDAAALGPLLLETLYRVKLRGHNIAFDAVYTFATIPGASVERITNSIIGDTRHMAYALRQSNQSLGLELLAYDWAQDMAGYEEEFVLLKDRYPELLDPGTNPEAHYARCPADKWETHLKPYVMGDVEVVHQAAPRIDERLRSAKRYEIPLSDPNRLGHFRKFKTPGRHFVYNRLMLPASRTLTRIQARGMFVDQAELAVQEDLFPKMIRAAREEMRKVDPRVIAWCEQMEATEPGWTLDLESRDQLKTIFFDILRMPVKRLTSAGEKLFPEELSSYPYEQLTEYAAIDKFTVMNMVADHPNLKPFQEYRKLHKAYTTYVRSMRNIMAEGVDKKARTKDPYLMRDSCVHPTYNQAGTRGGRLSCVAGDTVLFTNLGPVAIQDLEINNDQQVLVKTHENRWRPIVRKIYKGTDRMFKVTLENGATIKCTANHRFLSPRGWVQLGRLKVGDRLCSRGPEHSAGSAREGKTSDKNAANGTRVCAAVPRAQAHRSAVDESRDEQENYLVHTKALQRKFAGARTRAEGAIFSKVIGGCDGKPARSAPSVSVTSTGGAGIAAGEGMASIRDSAPHENVGLYRGPKYPVLRAETPDDTKSVADATSGIRVDRNRQTLPWNFGCVVSRWDRQENVREGGLRCVREVNGDGQFLERHLQASTGIREISRSDSALYVLVVKQVRDGDISGSGRSSGSVYQRDGISPEQEGRFCVCRDESCPRIGRSVPYARFGFRPGFGAQETWLRGDSIHDRRGGKKPCWSCSSCTGTSSIASIESISDMGVWDVEVLEDHSYQAQGFINHNSSNPNSQQISRDSIVKRLYTSRFGKTGLIAQYDASQIELRLLAAGCGDPTMVKAYHDNIDLHSLTTSRVFNVPYEHFEKTYMAWLQEKGREKEAKELDRKRKIGKCVDPDTIVEINGQLTRISSVHPGREPDTFYPVPDSYTRRHDGVVRVNRFYCNGEAERLLVVARHGIVACTAAHPFRMSDGSLKRAEDLRQGDVLAPITPMGDAYHLGRLEKPDPVVTINPFGVEPASCDAFSMTVDENWAHLLGMFYGDGCSNIGEISIATGGKPEYFEWQDRIAESVLKAGLSPKICRTIWDSDVTGPAVVKSGPRAGELSYGSSGKVILGSTRVSDLFVQLGAVDLKRRRTLKVPDWLLNAGIRTKVEFIAGVYDTDGSVVRDGTLSMVTKSWVFAQDLTVMMRSIGMHYTTEAIWNKTYKRHYYRINIPVRHGWEFLRGKLWLKSKSARIKKPAHVFRERENSVRLVKPIGTGPVFDLNVDHHDHLFCCSGLTCRNTTNFLTGYGGGAFGLQSSLAEQGVYLPLEECERIVEALFDTYPGLRKHIGLYKRFILDNGCAVSITGRVRAFEDAFSDDGARVSKALRSGFNHLIQPTASDMILCAGTVIENLMRQRSLESILISTVHDSLIIDAKREEMEAVHEICDGVMNDIPSVMEMVLGDDPEFDSSWLHVVPFAGDGEVGKNYLEALKIVPDKVTGKVDWDRLFHQIDKVA